MAAEPQRNRLPFEPNKKRQKPAKDSKTPPETAKKAANSPASPRRVPSAAPKKTAPLTKEEEKAIPKVVSDRMARRIALFCGIPTALGMVTFVGSYIVFIYGFKLPNVVVLLVSIGFFALGVLGLSYGVISASWDEEIVGSKLGWREFTTNWGRLRSAWRSERQKNV